MVDGRMYLAIVEPHVIGVFSTIDKAISAIKAYDEDSYIHCNWNVQCIYLDEVGKY